MAVFKLNELLTGVRRLFVGLQGKKSDDTYEDLQLSDSGKLLVESEVKGSVPEYGWNHAQTAPTPSEPFAIGVRVELDNTMTTMHWNGTQWDEVV